MAGGSWQEGVQCRLVIDLTSQGHSAKWNFICDFLYVNNGNWSPILHNFRDISQNSVIMGVKKQIWPPCRHFLNQTENKWAFSLHQVWKKSSCSCLSYGSKSVYIQDGRQAAILNDIKNLFDVHNPQTVPVLGLKFQTSWPIHFWEIAVHGRTDGRTYGRTDGGQIISPPFWGLKIISPPILGANKSGKYTFQPKIPEVSVILTAGWQHWVWIIVHVRKKRLPVWFPLEPTSKPHYTPHDTGAEHTVEWGLCPLTC